MTFREAADRESGLCYNIGVQVNLLFDCPKKGASMKQSSNKKSREATAFLYERLSRDDNLEGESYSIGNQKKLLTKVAKEKGYTNLVHFLDDGISGVTMNRPGFVEMMQQLEQGKASAVFVKDLSRLGRNYIEVGRLTEEFFPDHDIRLVAVSDNIDTAEGENELAPIRNLFNEWYARDISKKRRISNKIKGNSGEPMGLPPYGYIKDPNNPKHWVIDEEAAQVVRRIFDMTLEGFGTEQIATQFEKEGILTPQAYWIQKGIGRPGKTKTRPATKWNGSTITHLLYQQEYCGDVLNFKTYSKSYKFKKRLPTPEDQQMIFENTHPALVEQEAWEQVQRLREGRPRPTKQGEMALFSGLLFCADCGSPLRAHRGQNISKNQECYCCGKYRDRTNSCTMHYIRAVVLENLVLENLKQTVTFALENEQEFVRRLMNRSAKEQQKQIQSMKKELAAKERRIGELDNIIKRLYEDNLSGKLSDERFKILSADYEKEQRDTRSEIADIQKQVNEAESKVIKIDSFLKIARKYTSFEELSRGMLHDLIEKIVIHEGDKSSGHRQQKIDIYYTFIGEVGATQLVAQLELKGKAA